MPALRPSPTVAVVIPAKDEQERIAATVRAVSSLPVVDVVVVVDDGSSDLTSKAARDAGAVVVAHRRNRGKAAAMHTGARAVAERERARPRPGVGPRPLLFVDADLADSAVRTAPLAGPVLAGEADMTIAVLPRQATAGGGRGLVVGLSRKGTVAATGWSPEQPLSGMRCLTRAAFEAALPLAPGWGVETALTIDLLRAGFRVREVPCDLHHRVTGKDLRAQLHRAAQYRDVARALGRRRVQDALRRLTR
ncbi:glycosyltransferase [Kineococcus rhizosphaerae]|uniref:Glucosyl-3-phosphoglycerate synthase n=1 Tax=Kineococcus rhizosphaerae TaxID=559628 RepID=A0A2T0QX37_9ACTN|nr:glycosyltransferase [Kineococcus rhizosphaerae]PRY10035.1 glycosyl transferase family 2 [Kineococcus rhizosphaerae]